MNFGETFGRNGKAGSLSTRQIVLLIILIAGFTVILVFLFQLNLGEESKAQICRNTVSQASNLPSKSASSLKCTTKYVCITSDGSCDDMVEPDKTVKVESKEEIYEELSEQKAQCWWMFGSGKVDYVGDDITKGNYCSICHQSYFDDSLSSLEGVDESISKDELYDYMTKHNYSDAQTYSQFVFGTNRLNSLKKKFSKSDKVDVEQLSFGNIDVNRTYFNVMGITSDTSTIGWVLTGAVIGGTIALGVPTGGSSYLVAGAIVVGGGVAGGGAGYAGSSAYLQDPVIGALTVRGIGIDNKFMAPTFQEANSDKFKALNCENVITDSN